MSQEKCQTFEIEEILKINWIDKLLCILSKIKRLDFIYF